MLSELEMKILSSIQGDIPVTKKPFLELAEKIGTTEKIFLEKLNALYSKGVIRRFGATLRHQKSGYLSNAMVAWKVEEDRVEEVGKKMASFRQVSHCYRRNPTKTWPYNLYTMVHAKDEKSCFKIAEKISDETSTDTYSLLFSRRELKKTSMQYFPTDEDI